MEACPGYRSPLQFHRFKDCHRIDQTGPGRAPLNLEKPRLRQLVLPFKSKGIAREFRRRSQGFPVRDIIIEGDQSVRRNLIMKDLFLKVSDGLIQSVRRGHQMLHNLKALPLQKTELLQMRIPEINAFCLYERKGEKADISAGRNLIVQLANGTAAQIAGVLVMDLLLSHGFIDLLKIRIGDDRLPAQDQLSPVGNSQRKVPEHSRVAGNHLADLAVAAGNCLLQLSLPVSQHHRQTVQFPGNERLLISYEGSEHFNLFCFIEREHRLLMPLLRQLFNRLVSDPDRRTARKDRPGLFLQRFQFLIEPVILIIAHDLPVLCVICLRSLIQSFRKLFHASDGRCLTIRLRRGSRILLPIP